MRNALQPTTLIDEMLELVSEITGLQFGQRQTAMVQSRLTKRMLDLGFATPEQYIQYLRRYSESEVVALISILTTHHTQFFREFHHFEFLKREGLPRIIENMKNRGENTIHVWSAACSRGQEAYSLSMFLAHHLKEMAPQISYKIFGCDIDPQSISFAQNGVYRWNEIKEVPAIYLNNHWQRGTAAISHFVKARRSLKSPCHFAVDNLLEPSALPPNEHFHIVFCRNVFIYFAPDQIRSITQNILKRLSPFGLIFIGISETLDGLSLPIRYLGESIYGHRGHALKPVQKPTVSTPSVSAVSKVPVLQEKKEVSSKSHRITRILCVDDSPTVLALLKRILTPEHGFEVVATAKNGLEAKEMLKAAKVDAVTLDLHMPEQDGISYLAANASASHPPIVIVSSVSRSDAEVGMRALELGAHDFVEKPTLVNFSEKADEIRTKLRAVLLNASYRTRKISTIEKAFAHEIRIKSPEKKLRVILSSWVDREKIIEIIGNLKPPQPPTLVLMVGATTLLEKMKESIAKAGTPISIPNDLGDLLPDQFYLSDYSESFSKTQSIHSHKKTSVLVLGVMPEAVRTQLLHWPNIQLVVEDLGPDAPSEHQTFQNKAAFVVTYSSFAYESNLYLSED
ncbi:MAG: response regulator [Deltaproteobacteria bacterium]|nr:response regulator [Deltaproteobacteria bacterium]